MGYSLQRKGYKFWDIKLKKLTESRDVTFQEVYSTDVMHSQLLNIIMEPTPADSSSNDNTRYENFKQKKTYHCNDAKNLPETQPTDLLTPHADIPAVRSHQISFRKLNRPYQILMVFIPTILSSTKHLSSLTKPLSPILKLIHPPIYNFGISASSASKTRFQ